MTDRTAEAQAAWLAYRDQTARTSTGTAATSASSSDSSCSPRRPVVADHTTESERIAAASALHRRVPVLQYAEDCGDDSHDHTWGEDDLLCFTCPATAWVCGSCYGRDGEAVEWPCPTHLALHPIPSGGESDG